MPLSTYKLHRIYARTAPGSTHPARCAMSAILKFDHAVESPHCVYNEFVAHRLARLCDAPVADGCLTVSGDGHSYASLEIGSPGLPLPDVTPSRRDRVAELYPYEAAALLAFDLWIGNRDRGGNLKATVVTPHIRLFAGYDHSHALLHIEEDPWHSIERLNTEGDLIVRFHPFYGRVYHQHLQDRLFSIGGVTDEAIHQCCRLGQQFRGVTEEMQEALAVALCNRKVHIWDLDLNEEETIYGLP